jgi:hypothetical protein
METSPAAAKYGPPYPQVYGSGGYSDPNQWYGPGGGYADPNQGYGPPPGQQQY